MSGWTSRHEKSPGRNYVAPEPEALAEPHRARFPSVHNPKVAGSDPSPGPFVEVVRSGKTPVGLRRALPGDLRQPRGPSPVSSGFSPAERPRVGASGLWESTHWAPCPMPRRCGSPTVPATLRVAPTPRPERSTGSDSALIGGHPARRSGRPRRPGPPARPARPSDAGNGAAAFAADDAGTADVAASPAAAVFAFAAFVAAVAAEAGCAVAGSGGALFRFQSLFR